MNDARILQELEALAEQLGVEVRHESLAGPRGGLCRVGNRDLIFIDRDLSPAERVELFSQALSRLPLDNVFVAPAVRQVLDRCEPRASSSSS